MTDINHVQIQCKDGYLLSGTFYPAQTDSPHALPVVIAPATGIGKKFYHAYSSWLASKGYHVLSFDFRGIGESLYGKVKDSEASILDWGQLDLPAAIEHVLDLTKAKQVVVLGHSAGGQLLGVVPNYQKVAKVVAVAGSSGYQKGLKGRTKILAPVMFKLIFPIARYTIGYGPTQAIGMGENLPKDVARQWAIFCSKSGYISHASGQLYSKEQDYHANIQCPITSIFASDDEIATPVTVPDFLKIYPNAKTDIIELNPKSYGHRAIGHMLMFKSSHQNLWPIIEAEIAKL